MSADEQQSEQTYDIGSGAAQESKPEPTPRPVSEPTPAQRLAAVEKFIEGYRKKHPYDHF